MVLPLLIPVIIIAGTAMTGGGGIGAGAFGVRDIRQAKADMKADASRYDFRFSLHERRVEETNLALQELGRSQECAQRDVVFRMTAFLERNAKQVRVNEHLILDGLGDANEKVIGLVKLDADVAGWVRGVVGSTVIGTATPAAIRAGVMSLAAAGTGTAITELSGIAAANATLAWIGGGSLAAGGGGIALGGAMLNVAAVGPTLLIAGITVKTRGTKAKTEADKYRTDVEVAIAEMGGREEVLRGVRLRAAEIGAILVRLKAEAVAELDTLESEPFDIRLHAEALQRALILAKSVSEVSTAPILDAEDDLDATTEVLVIKYRERVKEEMGG